MRVKTIISLIVLLLLPGIAVAEQWCIKLTTPLTRPNPVDYACLVEQYRGAVDWRVGKEIAVRISLGYFDGVAYTGTWMETAQRNFRVENLPAKADDPNTPLDETVAADPQYDNFTAAVKAVDLNVTSIEKLILLEAQKRFPELAGVIE